MNTKDMLILKSKKRKVVKKKKEQMIDVDGKKIPISEFDDSAYYTDLKGRRK